MVPSPRSITVNISPSSSLYFLRRLAGRVIVPFPRICNVVMIFSRNSEFPNFWNYIISFSINADFLCPCTVPHPVQSRYRRKAILDQGKDLLARTLPPVITGVIGILHLFTLGEAIVAADRVY